MRNDKNAFGYRFENLERKMTKKTFGESKLVPNWETWVRLLHILQETETLVISTKPTYENSPTVTWIHIIARVMNVSWRRDNPIRIIRSY